MSLRRLSVMIRRTQDLEPKRAMFKIKWRREWDSKHSNLVVIMDLIWCNTPSLPTFFPTRSSGCYGISWDCSARGR